MAACIYGPWLKISPRPIKSGVAPEHVFAIILMLRFCTVLCGSDEESIVIQKTIDALQHNVLSELLIAKSKQVQ